MKYVIAVILVIIMITVLLCTMRDSGLNSAEPLTREEIITAAKEYFQTQTDSLLEPYKVFYDEGNVQWKEHGSGFLEHYPGEAHKAKLLEGHDYQMVYFSPGGDVIWLDLSGVYVFVDRYSGDAITSLWGKLLRRKPDTSEKK